MIRGKFARFCLHWAFVSFLWLCSFHPVAAQQLEEQDTTIPSRSIISADTILVSSIDTSATPWYNHPFWLTDSDTLRVEQGTLQPINEIDPNLWIAGIIVLALLIVGLVRVMSNRYFESLFKAIINYRLLRELYEEEDAGLTISAFALNSNFLLTTSLFVYLIVQYTGLAAVAKGIVTYAIILVITLCLYLVRYVSLKMLYFLFPHLEEINFYNFHFFLVHKAIGIAIIPFLLLLAFAGNIAAEVGIYGIAGIASLLLLLHLGRGVFMSKKYWQNDVFHFFLYICSLELAPSIVIIKSLRALFL